MDLGSEFEHQVSFLCNFFTVTGTTYVAIRSTNIQLL
jgi:hypothetical protein